MNCLGTLDILYEHVVDFEGHRDLANLVHGISVVILLCKFGTANFTSDFQKKILQDVINLRILV